VSAGSWAAGLLLQLLRGTCWVGRAARRDWRRRCRRLRLGLGALRLACSSSSCISVRGTHGHCLARGRQAPDARVLASILTCRRRGRCHLLLPGMNLSATYVEVRIRCRLCRTCPCALALITARCSRTHRYLLDLQGLAEGRAEFGLALLANALDHSLAPLAPATQRRS